MLLDEMKEVNDKLKVTNTGYVFEKKVSGARNDCCDASSALRVARGSVENYWRGEAGDAMAAALKELNREVSSIVSDLSELERKLHNHIEEMHENWEVTSSEV